MGGCGQVDPFRVYRIASGQLSGLGPDALYVLP